MPDAPAPPALLADTHVWIWMVEGVPGRLSAAAVDAIEGARDTGRLLVSAMSVWEVGMLEVRGRLALSRPVEEWVRRALDGSRIALLPLEPDIALASTRLPGTPHGDPADLVLMASARVTGARLVTCDGRILQYAGGGHVPVLDARA